MNALRGSEIAMVFQDPSASLHPMLSIERQLTDHVRHHNGLSKKSAAAKAIEMLETVKVPEPEWALKKYPHQFSGGQLQRIAIASAIMCDPAVLIADEPTTALDVTVQAGILRLLRQLCDDLDLAVLLVTHDLGVMSALADTIAVMHAGEVVEFGDRYQVITAPRHEYTKSLINALPQADGSHGISATAVVESVAGAAAAAAGAAEAAAGGGSAAAGGVASPVPGAVAGAARFDAPGGAK
jgi:peptide/nickel transport system ATP-binding protein